LENNYNTLINVKMKLKYITHVNTFKKPLHKGRGTGTQQR
jgi:hypothetical protein